MGRGGWSSCQDQWMSDETQSAGTSSPLFSRVNAAPFVPSSRGELLPRSGSSTNVNAKPFVPGAGRAANQAGSLGAEAKPFVPSTNGGFHRHCDSSHRVVDPR